jgi:selenoprotein W-related protein
LKDFEPEIEKVTLIPSTGGRFEVEINGQLVYSKMSTGRHAQAGEVIQLVQSYLKERK